MPHSFEIDFKVYAVVLGVYTSMGMFSALPKSFKELEVNTLPSLNSVITLPPPFTLMNKLLRAG